MIGIFYKEVVKLCWRKFRSWTFLKDNHIVGNTVFKNACSDYIYFDFIVILS